MSGLTDHAPPLRASRACDMSGITDHAPPLRVTIWCVRLLRHRRVRTTTTFSRACDMSGLTDHAPPLRASRACDMSGLTDHAPPLRVTNWRVRLLRHRRVRTTTTFSRACDMSGITDHAPPLRVTIRPDIEKSELNSWRRNFRTRGTESVSFVGRLCIRFECFRSQVDFVDGSNHRFGRQVDYRGSAVGAPIEITSLGNVVSSREIAFSGNNLEGALSGKEWSYVLLHEWYFRTLSSSATSNVTLCLVEAVGNIDVVAMRCGSKVEA